MSKMVKFVNGHMISYEVLKLVDKYDPVLHKPTIPVDFNNLREQQIDTAELAYSLVETMNKLGGLGLSANQVGIPYRVCVINVGKEAHVMFNPKVIMTTGNYSKLKEGCLSFPGLYLEVGRLEFVTVEFYAIDGSKQLQSYEGIHSICVQHEIDHLDGICYTKKVSPLVLEREKKKVKKNLRKIKEASQRFAQNPI